MCLLLMCTNDWLLINEYTNYDNIIIHTKYLILYTRRRQCVLLPSKKYCYQSQSYATIIHTHHYCDYDLQEQPNIEHNSQHQQPKNGEDDEMTSDIKIKNVKKQEAVLVVYEEQPYAFEIAYFCCRFLHYYSTLKILCIA